jgi:chloride channel 7
VASAFSSPITGLTYAMEEMSTHWTSALTWQTFVTCIIARSTTELLHTVLSTLMEDSDAEDEAEIKVFKLSESALFDVISCLTHHFTSQPSSVLIIISLILHPQMKVKLELSLSVFIPTLILGVLGGLLGSLYIFMHLKMAQFRRSVLRKFTRVEFSNAFKVVEVVLLCVRILYRLRFMQRFVEA